ncbi:hypothetical protein [Anaeromyxobacter sp. PSR-1]|uniref:hypothetical protein n=1 Tax=Anaeromyxobacter sp. PSR-1 TaxID=1300915 RepID=UPI0005E2751C|nr:hypothetical protein [Anaeromyxobacter sp. PSR-1]GAO01330.1 hypothetical protein PSR1_00184 [Anaeromyxobacter sp. PSR-1]
MTKRIAIAALAALALAACGGSDSDPPSGPTLDTATAIGTYLDGKRWVMTGNDIPTYPNGYSEDVNYGAATQCYNRVTLSMAASTWTTVSALGTLTGAPNAGDTGDCDRTTVLATLPAFNSNAVLIENVAAGGACFDITVTYTGFAQEGRGKFSADGRTMTLELFFSGQATGHRCANGAVGASSVTLNGAAFTGNAQQVYRLQ